MSMPKIEIEEIDFQDALSNILASIALGEAGLAHIMNAEGMKIQHAIAREDVTVADLTKLNQSVTSVAEGAASIEAAFKLKLETIMPWVQPEPPADQD